MPGLPPNSLVGLPPELKEELMPRNLAVPARSFMRWAFPRKFVLDGLAKFCSLHFPSHQGLGGMTAPILILESLLRLFFLFKI
jgi:hypothetical protein